MFKKIVCFASAIIVLVGMWVNSSVPIFKKISDTYELYLGSASSLAEIVKVSDKVYPFTNDVKGESCVIDKNIPVEEILQSFNAELKFVEITDDGKNYYAYSNDIKYVKVIDGKLINLHICVGKNQTKLGSPIIFGSF